MVYPGCSDNGSAGTRWALRGVAALHVAGSVLVLPQDLFVFLLVLLTGVCGVRASCDPRRGAPYLVMSSTLLVYHAAHVMRLCQNLALVSAPAGSLPGAPFPVLPVLLALARLALARLALSVVAVALGVACVGAAGPGLGPTAPGWGSGDGRAASPSLGDGQLRGASPCPEPPPTQDPTLWPQGRPAGGQVGGGVASCRPPAGGVPGPGAPAGARRALRVVAVLHLVVGALSLRWGWPALLLGLSTGVCGIRASDDPGRVVPCHARIRRVERRRARPGHWRRAGPRPVSRGVGALRRPPHVPGDVHPRLARPLGDLAGALPGHQGPEGRGAARPLMASWRAHAL